MSLGIRVIALGAAGTAILLASCTPHVIGPKPINAELAPAVPHVDDTTTPPKVVIGPQIISLTDINSDTNIRLHVQPYVACAINCGPLHEGAGREQYAMPARLQEMRDMRTPLSTNALGVLIGW